MRKRANMTSNASIFAFEFYLDCMAQATRLCAILVPREKKEKDTENQG
jgi:hypothetical protein